MNDSFLFIFRLNKAKFQTPAEVETQTTISEYILLRGENVSMKLQNGHCNTSKYFLFSTSNSMAMNFEH